LRRILLVLAAAALLVTMLVASAGPVTAEVDLDGDDVLDDISIFGDGNDDEEGDSDELDDVEVGDAFLDGNDICVPVVTTFEDGSTEEDEACTNASESFG
jgi:hypothetical protein